MSLNDVPSGERVHIGFFGRRNAGKSSVVNAVTNQELSVVSDVRGTTTDPVTKSMELLPMGPVVIIDTPGFDDTGELGAKRVAATRRVLERTDVAVLVVDATQGMQPCDHQLVSLFEDRGIPYLLAMTKADLLDEVPTADANEVYVSSTERTGIEGLKERIAALGENDAPEPGLVGDLMGRGSVVVLVIPIDKAAPKGRLILPEQQVIRDLLDSGATTMVVQDTELADALGRLREPPSLVITDSQVFKEVAAIVPDDVLLTSFSILMARHKGYLAEAVRGVSAVAGLHDGDRILVAEGCTHHRQCNDIGTVKIPRWMREYTGLDLTFESSSGRGFPDDLTRYALVVHCGGCMLNEREVCHRMRQATDQGVPMTNYGVLIAQMRGILRRSLRVLPDVEKELDE
ncbi:MAG: [FeFe] hydrogenase H-cluster maturation GTPase HydF [Atopobiaceae bacterium]|jgi:[FeFe] hydrogenase H-cluster maturation GTPase HydF|nr:[FeFe] hydrogenase H-cluster maturation GTPase HydF [Atopobiaceae bacterium]MCH4179895.1 [FeFe] hydrogenase H-cluster maturation GTPase HydF [Atopobiaceae bacterium]MCH4213646.1 [FeFe] hydrogenase H-cluster maturation GTPase HydF [Atopobiaceae bacterium]MCH4230309.1 [FeFe] hydrogenase H-cluster maturation GTPase HydF [Atopobiaceae bacterium]MCH4275997.1 [FeFe] hydrogenase H-cluster maturation GTPase HydF [Atopobiaceae bacterium]